MEGCTVPSLASWQSEHKGIGRPIMCIFNRPTLILALRRRGRISMLRNAPFARLRLARLQDRARHALRAVQLDFPLPARWATLSEVRSTAAARTDNQRRQLLGHSAANPLRRHRYDPTLRARGFSLLSRARNSAASRARRWLPRPAARTAPARRRAAAHRWHPTPLRAPDGTQRSSLRTSVAPTHAACPA